MDLIFNDRIWPNFPNASCSASSSFSFKCPIQIWFILFFREGSLNNVIHSLPWFSHVKMSYPSLSCAQWHFTLFPRMKLWSTSFVASVKTFFKFHAMEEKETYPGSGFRVFKFYKCKCINFRAPNIYSVYFSKIHTIHLEKL